MLMTPEDASYLAGLLDGEGCIGYRTRKDGWSNLDLAICMTTPAPLHWAQEATGYGRVYKRPEKREGRRDAYFWKVGRLAEIAEILTEVRPYMKVKQYEAGAMLALAHLRSLKPYFNAKSPYPELEKRVGRLIQELKRPDWTGLDKEAFDIAVDLRQALEERDERGDDDDTG